MHINSGSERSSVNVHRQILKACFFDSPELLFASLVPRLVFITRPSVSRIITTRVSPQSALFPLWRIIRRYALQGSRQQQSTILLLKSPFGRTTKSIRVPDSETRLFLRHRVSELRRSGVVGRGAGVVTVGVGVLRVVGERC